MQHLICPFFFFTGTILTSQVGCCIDLIKPTSRSFYISCLICIYNSSQKYQDACFTSLVPSLVLSLWMTSCESRHGISAQVQANTSPNSRNSVRILQSQARTQKHRSRLFIFACKIYLDQLVTLVFRLFLSCLYKQNFYGYGVQIPQENLIPQNIIKGKQVPPSASRTFLRRSFSRRDLLLLCLSCLPFLGRPTKVKPELPTGGSPPSSSFHSSNGDPHGLAGATSPSL